MDALPDEKRHDDSVPQPLRRQSFRSCPLRGSSFPPVSIALVCPRGVSMTAPTSRNVIRMRTAAAEPRNTMFPCDGVADRKGPIRSIKERDGVAAERKELDVDYLRS